ncbi:Sodium- and chloride-dependent creatine transporter 1 [Mactra antiquata]
MFYLFTEQNTLNKSGAFLIPYLICLVTCGIPIFLLELALGQFMGVGSVEAWTRLAPALKGIGISSFIVTTQMNTYYIIVLVWAGYYLVNSFTGALPWATCNNAWNTDRCFSGNQNISVYNTSITNGTERTVDASIEFWEISDGIDEPGNVVPGLAVALIVAWTLVFVCVCKGVRWTGKIVYFTAIFPYVILTALFVRGITLEGASDGIYYYLYPDFTRLQDPQVWIDGGTQIFFSYAVALGVMISMGSYNKFRNNFYRDCFIISSINSCTSLFGGFAVFSVLGYMAQEQNVTVAEVVDSGPGLVFITYPKAVSKMPLSPFWAVLFFIMIILVGFDSQFVDVEGFLTPVLDAFPNVMYKDKNRILMTAGYCICSCLVGLAMVTEGGMYVFQLFDYYSASGLVLLWICFFEAVAVGWVFGQKEFQYACELMLGRRISAWFFICWKFIVPVITMAIFLFMLVSFTPLKYGTHYTYPRWAQGIGFCMALVSMSCVPLGVVHAFFTQAGSFRERLKKIFKVNIQDQQKMRELDIYL